MNLWAAKTLINVRKTDVELPLQIFSNNTSIPIVLTETIASSIPLIDEDIVSDNNRAIAFFRLKK
jgi:hypothetical protein